MVSPITFSAKPAKLGRASKGVLAVVGTRERVLASLDAVVAAYTDLQAGDANLSVFRSLLESAEVPANKGAQASMVVPNGDGSAFLKLVGVLTPTKNSRHNAPSRPDVVTRHARDLFKVPSGQQGRVLAVFANAKDSSDALCLGSALARAFPLYSRKKDSGTDAITAVDATFWAESAGADEATLKRVQVTADGVRRAAAMVDAPCNELHTSEFVARARAVVDGLVAEGVQGVAIGVIEGEALRERGFGGIYGVGKAAAHPPALVHLSFKPAGATETVAWVGKGIVYDTGGLSLKTPVNMPGMKGDMGGAAAIMCAWEAAARLQGGARNIHALLCLAENAIGPLATRPDDIHTLYSGCTVEINNTDAEGRLVLSDGVAFAAKHLDPATILNMCTLTGAQGISTGQRHAAVVSNNDETEALAVRAGKASGDLTWPLLYCPEFLKDEFHSEVADFKNSVKRRNNAQSSCAAQFIANSLCGFEDKGNWCHVDMAAPSTEGERGTGYGVALLMEMFC